jgi:hypothetical protein
MDTGIDPDFLQVLPHYIIRAPMTDLPFDGGAEMNRGILAGYKVAH